MPVRTHREWFDKVSKLREQLATDPANLKIAQELWAEMGATSRYNVRTGHRAIETFQSSALKSDEGLEALVKAIRSLATQNGEYPRAELFAPPLENLLRHIAQKSENALAKDAAWILKHIDASDR